jgi:hypothetical protein
MNRWLGGSLLSFCVVACGGDDEGGGDTKPKPNEPPVLTAPSDLTMQQGRATHAYLAVNDPNGDPITVTPLPPAGVEASVLPTGLLDAYADYSVSGAHVLPLTIADDKGASSDATIALSIGPLRWLERKTWTTAGPEAREHGALIVDGGAKRILLFGGSGYAPQGTPLGDGWQFDLETATWSAITPTGDVPPPAGSRRVAQVPNQSIAYLFGGYGTGFANLGNLYRLDYSGGGAVFTELTQNNAPPARSLHGFAYDAQTDRLFAFAGIGTQGAATTILGDLWTATIDGDSVTWTDVSPSTAPSPRYGFFYGVDEAAGRLLLFSGAQQTQPTLDPARDTWALDLRANPPVWTLLLEGDAVPPGRRNGCFVMDPLGPRLFVWGGTGDGATTEKSLFALDARPGKERWSTLDLAEEPPLRSSGMAAFDPGTDRVWLGFGNDAAVYRDFTALGY